MPDRFDDILDRDDDGGFDGGGGGNPGSDGGTRLDGGDAPSGGPTQGGSGGGTGDPILPSDIVEPLPPNPPDPDDGDPIGPVLPPPPIGDPGRGDGSGNDDIVLTTPPIPVFVPTDELNFCEMMPEEPDVETETLGGDIILTFSDNVNNTTLSNPRVLHPGDVLHFTATAKTETGEGWVHIDKVLLSQSKICLLEAVLEGTGASKRRIFAFKVTIPEDHKVNNFERLQLHFQSTGVADGKTLRKTVVFNIEEKVGSGGETGDDDGRSNPPTNTWPVQVSIHSDNPIASPKTLAIIEHENRTFFLDRDNLSFNNLLSKNSRISLLHILENEHVILDNVTVNGVPQTTDGRFNVDITEPTTVRINLTTKVSRPTISAYFNQTRVDVRNGETPPTTPTVSIEFNRTSKVTITGTQFNGGQPYVIEEEYSEDTFRRTRWLSHDLWDNTYGTKRLIFVASNPFGGIKRDWAEIEFRETDDSTPPENPEHTRFITSVSSNAALGFVNRSIDVSYKTRNIEQWPFFPEPGPDGRDRPMLVVVGIENKELSDKAIQIGTGSFSHKSIKGKIPQGTPPGTYKLFAQLAQQTIDGNDTRVYSNTLLTVAEPLTPLPPEEQPLTQDEVVSNILGTICQLLEFDTQYTGVLQNLLVTENSADESLIVSHIKDADGSVILKLYESLEADRLEKQKFYLVNERIDPYIVPVTLKEDLTIDSQLRLRGPNWDIDDPTDVGLPISTINLIDIGKSADTGYLRYNDIVALSFASGSTVVSADDITGFSYVNSGSVTTDILNKVISSSRTIQDTDLGIDFSNYNNFVFYSSAKERLINFKYKLQLIEARTSTISTINTGGAATSSLRVANELNQHRSEIEKIKNGFDGYEQFLYFTSHSASWPKPTGFIEHTTGSNSNTFFTSQSGVAELYDLENQYNLHKDLPEHIIRNTDNTPFLLFTSMIGHHFDLIKCHVDSLERIFVRSHDSGSGTPNKLVRPVLEAFGWQIRTTAAQQELSDYLLGKRRDGSSSSKTTAKAREDALLRRFLNNLPYLLKTKGTRSSIRALFTIYGIPSSIINIREFGGPKLKTNKLVQFAFDDPTAVLNMSGSEYIDVAWIDTNLSRKPDTIEFSFRTDTMPPSGSSESGSFNLVTGDGGSFNVYLDSEPTSSFNGRLRVVLDNTTISSSKMPFFDDEMYTAMIRRTVSGSNDNIDFYVKKSNYTAFTHEGSGSMSVSGSSWNSSSFMRFGNQYSGSIDEIRFWKVPLTEATFNHHVYWKESIRGNTYTGSLTDMVVRLPFDTPQDVGSTTTLTNYAYTGSTDNGYDVRYATASGFTSVAATPYQYEWTEHDSAFEGPMIAYKYESDKIRFESQSLVDGHQLNPFTRVTKKSFDQAPVDSNKVGVFFSPTTEINRDMIRAFGGHDFMNEIGDPESVYSSSYSSLDAINDHYWSRHTAGMNIYDYVTAIRQLDRSVFNYLEDVRPVRTKLVKGLLFEPHMLERNRVKHRKSNRESMYWEATTAWFDTGSQSATYDTHYASHSVETDLTITGLKLDYSASISTENVITASATYPYYQGLISASISSGSITGTYDTYDAVATWANNFFQSTSIDYREHSLMIMIGFEENYKLPYDQSDIGIPQSAFGLFAANGLSEIIYMKNGKETRKRHKLELITLPVSRSVSQLIDGSTKGQEGEYQNIIVSESVETLNVLNITGSFTAGSTPLNGYLPFHRVKVTDLTTGLHNSYYEGCKQTSATTIDGGSPVEWSLSKPGVLKVKKKDTDSDEPILEID